MALASTIALWAALLVGPSRSAVTRVDLVAVRLVARVRTPLVSDVLRAASRLGAGWTIRVLAWATIVALAVFRRFQHLLAYLTVLLVGSFVETVVSSRVARMHPVGVTILGGWDGYAHPSRPMVGLALVLAGITFTLVPAGPWRRRAKRAAVAVLAVLAIAELYLGTHHPTDVWAALAVGWALPAMTFEWAMPDEAFPVDYHRRPRAHLDVGGRRGAAIRQALGEQLGLAVSSVEPFGLGGSAGSTPLRLEVEGGAVFAKLYSLSHLRSDRLYKLVRSIRYGRLEDEKPFSSVRRLVEHEDHLLRVFRDLGLPTPKPYGVAEITPEREYVMVMEFLEGAHELGEQPLSTTEIDDGLAIVRTMWDVGLAHRDIKPSNLLVRDGKVLLIDVAFGAVRPTPWREAVDLANMMLTLALGSSAPVVYERALRVFTPEDVAEAFAASRGVTVPSQLKYRLRSDGRDLVGEFRQLSPPRPPVAIQRWSLRRVASTIGGVVAAAGVVWGSSIYARAAGLL